MLRVERLLAGLAVLALAPTPASACAITTAGVAFGVYDPAMAADGNGRISLRCHPSDRPAVSVDGLDAALRRHMSNGAERLTYNLYSDPARLTILGDGSRGTARLNTGRGATHAGETTYVGEIYGRIPAGQNVRAGSYFDTLFVTVDF